MSSFLVTQCARQWARHSLWGCRRIGWLKKAAYHADRCNGRRFLRLVCDGRADASEPYPEPPRRVTGWHTG